MKKGYKKLIYFISFIILILFTNLFSKIFSSDYIIDLFLVIILILFNFIFVLEKDRHRYMSDIIFEIIFFVVLYFIIFYSLGLVMGLYKTPNYLTFYGFKTIIIPIIVYCILREVLRYNMLCKAEGNKLCLVMVILLFISFDLSNNVIPTSFADAYSVLKYIALTVLPIFSRTFSYTYISKKMGYKPVIIFDLIFSLYPYFIPILPNPSEYIMALIYLLVPVMFAFKLVSFFDKKNDNLLPSDYHKFKLKGIILPLITIVIMFYFSSGYFRFHTVAIASGSMEPQIKIGDVVVIDNKLSERDLVPGTVIAFKHNDIVIVHRIVKSIKLDGKIVYYTKGDANSSIDDYLTEEESILGLVKIRLPFVGMPSVWFNKDR